MSLRYIGGTLTNSVRQMRWAREEVAVGWNIVPDADEGAGLDSGAVTRTAADILRDSAGALLAQANGSRRGTMELLLG